MDNPFLNTPWKVGKHDDNGDIVVRDSEDRILANFQIDAFGLRMSDIERHANAFAALPELVAALEEQVSDMEEDQRSGVEEGIYEDEPREDIEYLQALIKKAKGE